VTRYISTGILRYSYGHQGPKLILEVDDEIARSARSLLPRAILVQPPRYPAHITVVRNEQIPADRIANWGIYNNNHLDFSYSIDTIIGDIYYWKYAWCDRLVQIRRELGLPDSTEYTRPPDNKQCFHITIGNCKPR